MTRDHMNPELIMTKMTWMVVALVAVATPVAAQGVLTPTPRATQEQQATAAAKASQDQQQTVAAKLAAELQAQAGTLPRAAVQSRITRGAPYAAETLTESTQVLADGNRIVDRRITRVYRDAEGRTRTEQVNAAGEVANVTISDPVQGVSFVLNPLARTAFQSNVIMAVPGVGFVSGGGGRGGSGGVVAVAPVENKVLLDAKLAAVIADEKRLAEQRVVAGAVAGYQVVSPVAVPSQAMKVPDTSNVKREDLGQQNIGGVQASGSRVVTTIPAGAIGNEHPIEIVSEQWFSPDLQVLVQTRHSDPRSGETTYRLSNIVRVDQTRALFEVPPDYTMQQSVIRRELKR